MTRTRLTLVALLLAALAACGPHTTPTPSSPRVEGDTLAPFQMQTLHPADEDHR